MEHQAAKESDPKETRNKGLQLTAGRKFLPYRVGRGI